MHTICIECCTHVVFESLVGTRFQEKFSDSESSPHARLHKHCSANLVPISERNRRQDWIR